jgi:hypothetical protein
MWHRALVLGWREFASEEPELAAAGRALLYQFGVGLAFLSTVRADGAPRLNPMCPLIDETGLYAFLVPGPKRDDLNRDGRYAMHSFPTDDNEDAFSLAGMARPVDDPDRRRSLAAQFLNERSWTEPPKGFEGQDLFVFELDRCLHTVTTGHGDPEPRHRIWRAHPIR